MTQVNISGEIDRALRKYAKEHCLNVSKFVHKLIKQELEKKGIIIGESDDPSKITVKSD